MPKCALVLTSIYDTNILDAYFKNFTKFDHINSVKIFYIPDRKTPENVYYKCKEVSKKGLSVSCPNIAEQEEFLLRIGFNPILVPYDSDNRRNVGYLMALESAVDFVISIDDDNFCMQEEDFFEEHAIVCNNSFQTEIVNSSTGWYNICQLLEFDQPGTTYPRGFPYFARHLPETIHRQISPVPIHINAGLWLKDPDVDGITWLVNPMLSKSFKGRSVVLARDTWTPVNSQNTAMRSEAIAAYYFIRMRYPLLGGLLIDRYGDIFSGYFSQACMRHLGGAVRIGSPLANHLRNSHNYMSDAVGELACIVVLEDLLAWLTTEARLSGKSYVETYTSLSFVLEDVVETFRGKFWNDATRAYFHQIAYCMRMWAETCQRLTS
jgi:hypothetical protein